MTDGPIIFSAPMIRALLDGRKTMTRRLAWSNGRHGWGRKGGASTKKTPTIWQKVESGDWLWVKESHWMSDIIPNLIYYRADHEIADPDITWINPMYMPRWKSRITLTVTATKLERLQDISEGDAKAEGAEKPILPYWPTAPWRSGFRGTWLDLHGKDSWDANPEVVALTFTVHKICINARDPFE